MRRAVLSLLFLAISVASAQAEAEPVHRVVAVPLDDVLNVRLSASANAPLVGAIPPTAAGIEILGRPNADWAEIRYRRLRGFVAARFLEPVAMTLPEGLPEPLLCTGTEPFWSVRLAGGRAVYDSPDTGPQELGAAVPRTSSNSLLVRSFVAGGLTGVVTEDRFCSDGMSDTRYSHAITLVGPERTLSGCCRTDADDGAPAP